MMEKLRKSKTANLIAGVMLLALVVLVIKLVIDRNYENEAVSRGDSIILNGVRYEHSGFDEVYTISDVVICTTDDGRKLYEIEEYPEYEYIAVYSAWDGEIYKKE